ncbi:MAG: hypothetical protein D6765_12190 [Bacteroidetes bacterium]|nr:MAG: hypothetical protein D6765_12190 [Bacteroidota bacterium]
MPPKKFRLTGFARFLIFLLIATPLAYMGASYYNGEDGWANLKKLLGIESSAATPSDTDEAVFDPSASDRDVRLENERLKSEIDSLNTRIEKLFTRVERLEELLREKNRQLEEMKEQEGAPQ